MNQNFTLSWTAARQFAPHSKKLPMAVSFSSPEKGQTRTSWVPTIQKLHGATQRLFSRRCPRYLVMRKYLDLRSPNIWDIQKRNRPRELASSRGIWSCSHHD